MSIILFTGAGASAPFGYPTTNQFFSEELDETLSKRGRKKTLDEVHGILRKREPGTEKDVEEVFLLVEPLVKLMGTPTGDLLARIQADRWCEALEALLQLLRRHCFTAYGKATDENAVETIYTRWLESFGWPNSKVSLFTTNYDRIPGYLRKITMQLGTRFYDGFNDAAGEWDPRGYNTGAPGLDVYHLHGSLSWYEEDGTIRRNFSYDPLEGGIDRHILIYPGFKGDPGADPSFPEPIRYGHERLKEVLPPASDVIVVGYSFRDAALNKIFKDSLLENPFLRLHVVNRKIPEGAKELVEIAGDRLNHAAGHFEEDEPLRKVSSLLQATNS